MVKRFVHAYDIVHALTSRYEFLLDQFELGRGLLIDHLSVHSLKDFRVLVSQLLISDHADSICTHMFFQLGSKEIRLAAA